MVLVNCASSSEPATKFFATKLATTGVAAALCVSLYVAFALAPGGGVSAEPALSVGDIRLGVHSDSTRFVVDLSASIEPRVFGLADPYRIVVDFPEAEFALETDKTNIGAGIIANIRYGLFRPGTSRVVLDLRGPARIARQFLLAPENGLPWRLVIDLASTDHTDFVASMIRPAEPGPGVSEPPPITLGRPPDRPVIVLDAGHGGVDPGATSGAGQHEKDIVLAYARTLRDALVATGRYEVVMTRDRDIFLPLRDRVAIARAAHGSLFISLHTNSHPSASTRGFSVYTLSETASDAQTAQLAEQENRADIIGGLDLAIYGDDVAEILIDFARTRTNEQSVAFARDAVVTEVSRDAVMLTRPWRSAGFAVLKAPDVPSVLIELGYLTNRTEARELIDDGYRAELSQALLRAIDAYIQTEQSASRF